MMKLYLMIVFGCLHLTLGSLGPTPKLMKTAYCACICCEENESNCFRHPVIEPDYYCVSDMCSTEFCEVWQQSKCKTSCYCSKCKKTEPKDSFKCSLFGEEVIPNCECPDMDSIVCDTEETPKGLETSPEIEAAMKKLQTMKDNKHCIVPCFCSQCKESLPEHLRNDCEKAGEPDPSCVCDEPNCPEKESLEKLEQIMEQTKEHDAEASKALLRAKRKQIEEELEEVNRKLQPAIDQGKAKPMTKIEYLKAKCNAQCLCDKCRAGSAALDRSCDNLIKTRLEECPACDENIKCPGSETPADDCKLTCFCEKCKNDSRFTGQMQDKCDEKKNAECACDEPVDCSILDKLAEIYKKADEKNEEKSGKGKIKEKKKIWDEL